MKAFFSSLYYILQRSWDFVTFNFLKIFYFILFFAAMTELTASVCWNILAHKTDDISEVGVRIRQKPDWTDIYELRRKKVPPLCKEEVGVRTK